MIPKKTNKPTKLPTTHVIHNAVFLMLRPHRDLVMRATVFQENSFLPLPSSKGMSTLKGGRECCFKDSFTSVTGEKSGNRKN